MVFSRVLLACCAVLFAAVVNVRAQIYNYDTEIDLTPGRNQRLVIESSYDPVAKEATWDVTVKPRNSRTGLGFRYQPVGLALSFGNKRAFCESSIASSDCLSSGELKNSDANVGLFLGLSKTLLFSFKNAVNDPGMCQISQLTNQCSGKSDCENKNWGVTATYRDEWNAAVASQSSSASITVEDVTATDLNTAQGTKYVQYSFMIKIKDDFFGKDNSWNFGYGNGYQNFVTFVLSERSTGSVTTCNDAFHKAAFTFGTSNQVASTAVYTGNNPDAYKWTSVQITPTGSPSKSPTTAKPTTKSPTKFPTVPKPTKAPTTPEPTLAPQPMPCPDKQNWNKCSAVNSYFAKEKNARKKTKKQKGACSRAGCFWCSYTEQELASQGGGAVNCRPSIGEFGSGKKIRLQKEQVCPTQPSDPIADKGCELFETCPTPEEMRACNELSLQNAQNPRKIRKLCQRGFKIMVAGQEMKVGRNRCFYYQHNCRPVSDYWFARETIAKMPFYWRDVKSCPKA